MGGPCWIKLLTGPVDPLREEPKLELFVPEELHLMEGSHTAPDEECEESSPGRTKL